MTLAKVLTVKAAMFVLATVDLVRECSRRNLAEDDIEEVSSKV
jgi:hypothetical protein